MLPAFRGMPNLCVWKVPEKKKSYREIREEQLAAERAAKEAAEAEEVGYQMKTAVLTCQFLCLGKEEEKIFINFLRPYFLDKAMGVMAPQQEPKWE